VRVAFAATPGFGALVLEGLLERGVVPAVVLTQTDRPRGRGRRESPSVCALAAERASLPCNKIDDINDPGVAAHLRSLKVKAVVVASFGQILRPPLLEEFLCLNVHASLLPRYRGASPIQAALRAGDRVTGVSIMRMVAELDAGPVALRREVSLTVGDDAGTVERVLALLGALGMAEVLEQCEAGTAVFEAQEGEPSWAPKLTAADRVFRPDLEALRCHDYVRALSPEVGASAESDGLKLKIWRTRPLGVAGGVSLPAGVEHIAGFPGRVAVEGGRLFVGCAEGAVELLVLQPEGRQRMPAASFLRGYGAKMGEHVR